MKKIFCGIFLILMLTCCGLFYGCGDKYADLSLSIALSYSKTNEATTKQLENGDYRITTNTGVFDDHLDGSYTFYIKEGVKSSAVLNAVFKNAPDDFNYGVSYSLSNEIISIDKNKEHTSNGVKNTITAFESGTTVLTVYSNEGGKKASLVFNVVEIASDVSFSIDNLGLINLKDSQIVLNPDELILPDPVDSSITNISYNFGMLSENKFYPFTNLNNSKLYFDKYSYTLRALEDNIIFNVADFDGLNVAGGTTYDFFYIQATYENPLGDDLVCYTQVNLVNEVKDFELYYGSTNADIKTDNKITDVTDLIINIEDLNYVDIILRVKSNKELVKFNYLSDSNLPVYLVENKEQDYCDENKILDDSLTYDKATYTNYYYKVIALKKTTENDNYKDGEYSLKFICDYANYTVDNYPLIERMAIKNDTLVKNFSVNGLTIKNNGLVGYTGEIYVNNDESKLGTEFAIGVSNPIQIVNSNTAFKISILKNNIEIEEPFEIFSVKYKTAKSREIYEAGKGDIYYKGTTFYIKPKTSASVAIGESYVLKIVAEYPPFNVDLDEVDNRAVALIALDVKQGIETFDKYSYSYNHYVIDENGEYKTEIKIDAEGNEVEEKVIAEKTGEIEFDNVTLTAKEILNLDIHSNFSANIELSYLPLNASDKNIIISSSDTRVVKIELDEENGDSFKIIPISIGSAEVYITTTNIASTYTIPVNVYEPIANFDINFVSTTNNNGIGTYVKDESGNITSEVMVGKEIAISLTTLPLTASQYNIEYFVYKEAEEEGNLLGNYIVNYKGESSSTTSTLGNVDFQLNCKRNSFKFLTDVSVGDNYIVKIKLQNLDGSFWVRYINLKSYVPVEDITTEKTRVILYNPNTIAYSNKTGDSADPTVFGFKVETNKKSGRIATYGFDNYGELLVAADGETISKFVLREGLLNKSYSNDLIVPIYNYKDVNGYYWFKLNEEKFKTFPSMVHIFVQIKEFSNYVSFPPDSIRIYDAERVSNLTTSASEQVYFKQGITADKTFDINVFEESSYNKNLLVKVYDIIEFEDKIFYLDALQNDGAIVSDFISSTINKTEVENKFNLLLSSLNAGKSVVVIMPEDKIITKADYDKWFAKKYVEIGKLDEDTYNNFYQKLYTFDGANYSLAGAYNAENKYYILSTLVDDVNSLWKNSYLAFYISVADGVKVPFQISNIEELNEISLTTTSITKSYVLAQNLFFDTTVNFAPIGNYYPIVTNNYTEGYYFVSNGTSYELTNVQGAGNYFAYGFNGKFSGKFTYTNIKTGIKVINNYKISGLSFVGNYNYANTPFGLFATVGPDAIVEDLILNYSYYQPVLADNHIFGGITAINYGKINNYQVKYENYSINAGYKTIIGGLVGVNYGIVSSNNTSSTGSGVFFRILVPASVIRVTESRFSTICSSQLASS